LAEYPFSKYFDSIPHDRLLGSVAERVVGKNILRLIKRWLKAPVVEENEDGERTTWKNPKGTPQGGVISPLLANIYLHVLDRVWKLKKVQERFEARLIRYADDFVVLCRGNTQRVLGGIKVVLRELELSLNGAKTRVVDARKEKFNFLGFTMGVVTNPKTSNKFPLIRPSKKALVEIKAEIKSLTCRQVLCLPTEVVIGKLNEVVRGWVGYFYYGN